MIFNKDVEDFALDGTAKSKTVAAWRMRMHLAGSWLSQIDIKFKNAEILQQKIQMCR